MSLRDRLVAHLRAPDFSPANEAELARRLHVGPRQQGALAHEIRLLLKSGDYVRAGNGRIAPRHGGGGAGRRPERTERHERRETAPRTEGHAPGRAEEARKFFVPTRRGGPIAEPKPIPARTGRPAPVRETFTAPADERRGRQKGASRDQRGASRSQPGSRPGARPGRPQNEPHERRPREDQRSRKSSGPARTTAEFAGALPTPKPSAARKPAKVAHPAGKEDHRARRQRSERPVQPATTPAAPATVPPRGAKPVAAPPPSLRPDELVGRIQFRAGGSAFVVREHVAGEEPEPALQVFAEDTGVALPGDRVIAREFAGRKGRRPGEKIGGVMRVLERGRDTLVGDLRTGRRGFIVQPDDPRFQYEIHVDDPARSGVTPAPRPGDKVVVKLAEWRNRHEPLRGTLVSRLGRTHEPRAELAGVLLKYDLSPQFPPEVEREAAGIPDHVHARELVNRLDYRDQAVFTIDPDDAKDFDDALSYEELEGGDLRIGIHIADVSTYVKAGSALDREAQKRGNSTYLVGVVIPMLPEKLSNGLCSLVEGQDRLCKAVFLTFGKNAKIKDTSFANTVIRSRKRLTYKQAYALLFEDDLERVRALPLPPKHQTGATGRALRDLSPRELQNLQAWIRALWNIGSRLRRDRMAHGSLDLDFPETKIFVDEQGYADRLEKIEHDESHQLIEEFMLAANEAVARLTRSRHLPSLYRVHDEPDVEKLDEFRVLLDSYGVQVGDLTHREELLRLLAMLRNHPQGYTLRTQLLRSLKKAAYRHTPDGHFGLNKKDYTHFTSPIRRYADLVVHRVFDHFLSTQERHAGASRRAGYDIQGVERLGEHLSLTEVNSAEAERDSIKIKLLEYFERELEKEPRTRFAAIITDVRANGFFVELLESMTFGFVSAAALRDDYYSLNTSGDALVGRKRKKRFATNQRLEVVVDKVDRYKRLIDFRPAAG